MITKFVYQSTIPLVHYGDCHILGLSSDNKLYIEEFYDENFIAQHQIFNQQILISIDEDSGNQNIVPFNLDNNKSIIPDRPLKHELNYSGLRYRGLREAENVSEWLLPLNLTEKMPLLKALSWDLPAMLLLGIAESMVLAQVKLESTVLVCRRLRLAFAHERRLDSTGLPYDYDTRTIHLIHHYSEDGIPPLHESLDFAGMNLQRPMDMLYHDGLLWIADAASESQPSRILAFKSTLG